MLKVEGEDGLTREGHFDFVVPRGPSADGRGTVVTRFQAEGTKVQRLYPLEEVKPLLGDGELVRLRQRGDQQVFDVETLYRTSEEAAAGSGPPKVVSDAYRDGWNAVFGGKGKAPEEETN